MKNIKNVVLQLIISFTVLSSVFIGYAAWNDVVTQLSSVTSDIPPVLKGYISGLTLSNDVGDVNNDIQIATGVATSSDGTQYIDLNSVITKRLDATWAAGDNAGGLASGSKSSSTWYHVFLIWRTDGSVDAGFDTSLSATNLLARVDMINIEE